MSSWRREGTIPKQKSPQNCHAVVLRLLVCDSLQPRGPRPARCPCPSPSPRVCPGSRTLSPRCHPTKTIVFPIYSPKGPLIFLKSHLLFLTSLSPSPSALFLSSHLFSLKFPLPLLIKMDISLMAFPPSSVSKESTCNAEDLGSIPGSGRSSGEGNGNPLQSSCLENPMDRGAWRATVHGVTTVRHNLVTKLPPTIRPDSSSSHIFL